MLSTRVAGAGTLAVTLAVLVPGLPAGGPRHAPTERVIVRLVDPTPRAQFLLDVTTAPHTLPIRHELVVEGLREIHARALSAAGPTIAQAEAAGALVVLDRLWAVNAIVALVDPAWIDRLEADPAIAAVQPDRRLSIGAETTGTAAAGALAQGDAAAVPTPELIRIRVPEVWAQGITGLGAIVANVDTGVNGEDDTLVDRWRGRYAGADASWYAPMALTVFPEDDDPGSGHGTGTMGVLTGGENSFGVAYDATWMAGDLFEDSDGWVSNAIRALQWMMDPDGDPTTSSDVPDVVSNSYGLDIPDGTGKIPCDPIFNDAIDALEAAGAIVVWSAGNRGTAGVTSPANRTATAVNAFAVGAVDDSDTPLSTSGRGPSTCGGANATKPEVVAPGQGVQTRGRFNNTVFFSGTSFSTPMVGGVLALMRSKNPTITPEAAKTILLETARDLAPSGDDNATGRGFLDAFAALDRVTRPAQPLARLVGYRPAGAPARLGLAPAQASETLVLRPGETVDLVPFLTNHGPAIPASSAILTSPTAGVTVTRSTISLSSAATGAAFGPTGGESFGVEIGAGVAPGTDIALVMTVQGAAIGPFRMVIEAGQPIAGTFATHDRGRVRLSVTNFGGLGYYTGIHEQGFVLAGQGFRFPSTSVSWLFHASFMAATSAARLSDDIPYAEDSQNASDWIPLFGAPVTTDEALGAQRITTSYDDRRATAPLDLQIRQESFAFGDAEADDFILVHYIMTNTGSTILSGLRLGLFADWDLPGSGGAPAERAGWQPDARLGFVQGTGSQPALGVVWLDDVSIAQITYAVLSRDSIAESTKGSFAAGVNLAEATTDAEEFTDAEKWDALTSGQSRTSDSRSSDLWQVIGVGPVTLAAGASDTVAVALVGGETLDELRTNALAAREVYFQRILGQEPPPPPPPPQELVLEQNFPNPFRRGTSTTIQFAVPELEGGGTQSIELVVFDVSGLRVRTLISASSVGGEVATVWDGLDDAGTPAPAGVYIVRLVAGGEERTRRVLLVP
jgi:hypothetical protein